MPKIGGRRVFYYKLINKYSNREKQEPTKIITKNYQQTSQDVTLFFKPSIYYSSSKKSSYLKK